MPAYKPSDEEMDDAFYSAPQGGRPESVDEEEQENPSALLPKNILAGKKFNVGDEVVLKIVKDYGEEVEVEYASETPEKPAPEGMGMGMSAGDELDAMNEKG